MPGALIATLVCVARGSRGRTAHISSNALIKGGFTEIDGGNGEAVRTVNGLCVCWSGRPIRAKELRAWFGRQWTSHKEPQEGINAVYQERASDHHGHVLLKLYDAQKQQNDFRGTKDYPGWEIQEYYY